MASQEQIDTASAAYVQATGDLEVAQQRAAVFLRGELLAVPPERIISDINEAVEKLKANFELMQQPLTAEQREANESTHEVSLAEADMSVMNVEKAITAAAERDEEARRRKTEFANALKAVRSAAENVNLARNNKRGWGAFTQANFSATKQRFASRPLNIELLAGTRSRV